MEQQRLRRVAVIGSRPPKNPSDVPEMEGIIRHVQAWMRKRLSYGRFVLVSGGAVGVDSVAEDEARLLEISRIIIVPEYIGEDPRRAPLIRNQKLAVTADEAVAFPSSWSTGTRHAIECFHRANKPIEVFEPRKGP